MKPGSRMLQLACLCWVIASALGCGGSYEETVGSIKIPIPGGMTQSREKRIEVSLPGFGGAQATYQGKIDPDKVIDFYRKEMPARGWQPSLGLVSKGGMLTYVNETTTVIIAVTKTDSGTSMTITTGGTPR